MARKRKARQTAAATRAATTTPTVAATAAPAVTLLPYQRQDVESNDRFRWNCWARQTGKSFTKSLRRILRGLTRGRNQIFVSAGERQCRALMEKARGHCHALRIAADHFRRGAMNDLGTTALEIRLPRGVRIIGLPANPATVRGYTGDVFLDEFAMHRDDREIWAATFPTLLRGGGELDIASTPRGKGNLFYELRDNNLMSTSTLTLPQAVDMGLDADINTLRNAMGDDLLFRQEFLCEFIDAGTNFLDYDRLTACVDPTIETARTVDELTTTAPGATFAGIDLARLRDLTVIWLFCKHDGHARTAAVIELVHLPFARQLETITRVFELAGVDHACIDAGGLGMPLAEQLVETFGPWRVTALTFTAQRKLQLATALKSAVEDARISLPQDPNIIRDFHSVRREIGAAGECRLTAPRMDGSHADRFWAAAMAWHASGTQPPTREALPTRPLAFARHGTW